METNNINNGKKGTNAPLLRFPEFKDEWTETTLNDIADFSKGQGISKDQRSEDGTPCILYGELYTTYSSEIIDKVVSKTDIDPTKLVKSKANDVIIPASGETAIDIATARCVKNDNVLLGGDLNIIRMKDKKNLGDFFSYELNGIRRYDIAQIAQGVSVVHLHASDLKGLNVRVPSFEEQRKIADFLSLLDKRIELQKSAIEKLKSLKSAINNHLYRTCKDKFKTSINEIGNTYSGLSGKSANDFGSGSSFITYLNVFQNDVIDNSKFEKVRLEKGEKQNKVQYGDALFTLSSETPEEVGYGSVYLGMEEVYLNSFCFGLHINRTDLVFAPYLSCLFNTNYYRKFVYPLAQGSTRYNLQKTDFEKKALELPSYKSQKAIFKIYSYISERIKTETSLLEKYMVQKQYLLSKMFI